MKKFRELQFKKLDMLPIQSRNPDYRHFKHASKERQVEYTHDGVPTGRIFDSELKIYEDRSVCY